ncbi:hypothetical protein ES319_A10G056500v1 [Gossypium barbadense]|uniref:Peptidyl-tRNA hydrolase n=1 Tax=Gossypium barbadense TaxID=3634 RepID=A0A5J5U0Q7_GOSBA|nr:hypothetical protein ES319_A10G056500v1 [Gossypium barbadense]KAB2060983.1 hypothetical protein ES319_A10G056500v1 [Gossypium barbadense]
MITRRCFCSSAPRPWLFVGLGNPGDKYKGTRHNVGFEMIDAFAKAQGIEMNTLNCKAIFGQGFVGDAPLLLAKPQTYMNLSGESTGALAAYYKLPLNRVIVFHDDMDLPCGVLRLQDKGGHGSHNGETESLHGYELVLVSHLVRWTLRHSCCKSSMHQLENELILHCKRELKD